MEVIVRGGEKTLVAGVFQQGTDEEGFLRHHRAGEGLQGKLREQGGQREGAGGERQQAGGERLRRRVLARQMNDIVVVKKPKKTRLSMVGCACLCNVAITYFFFCPITSTSASLSFD